MCGHRDDHTTRLHRPAQHRFVQVALHERDCDRLVLPELTPSSRLASSAGYGQCVTVDAAVGTTTGISGADRARTARILADPRSVPDDFTRPGT